MGLARAAINLLLNESRKRPFTGRVVTLGTQHVYATADEVRAMAHETAGVTLSPDGFEPHQNAGLAARGFVSDRSLLKGLGFSEVLRVDVSGYEHCDELLDLNSPETPEHLRGRFDVVLDSGTIEHVFDLPAALRHCARLVKPGGRVIHLTPSSNCVEHGFYSVSPTLFHDFYKANGFDVADIFLCRTPLDLPRGAWDVYDYLHSPQRMIPLGMLDDSIWFTWSVAIAPATFENVTPQQGFYESTWRQAGNSEESAAGPESGTKAGRLLDAVKFSPFLTRAAGSAIEGWRSFVNSRRVRRHQLPYPYVGRF
ncbi:MAG TPA: class I SAM-dependent methyltransferase [Caulifigura sp.]|jgi:SAM-dependent methyltransferase|nr:class I SAM-dependent methyltransferase [Caulifigura sp.]